MLRLLTVWFVYDIQIYRYTDISRRTIMLAFIATTGIAIEYTSYQIHKRIARKLQNGRTPLSDAFEPQEWYEFAISKFKSLPETQTDMIQHLFHNIDRKLLSKDNVVDGLAMIFSAVEGFEPNDLRRRAVDELMECTRGEFNHRHTDHPYARINNPSINNAPMTPIYFPIAMKFAFGAIRRVTDIVLERSGYTRNRDTDTGCVFWENVWDDTKPILFFVHGIGIGVTPYAMWINTMRHTANVGGIILLEIPVISGQPVRTHATAFPTAQEFADAVHTALAKYSQPMIAMGHSYGTLILSYCMNHHPDMFARKILIDSPIFFPDTTKFFPVIFRDMSWPKIFNLVARGKFLRAGMDVMFAEVHVQHVFKNATWISEYVSREINLSRTLVVLSGRDHLIASNAVQKYLADKSEVETWMYHGTPHGGLLQSRSFIDRLVEHINRG
jgi:pimeloyl-ACP methyl ester carboxylesterase